MKKLIYSVWTLAVMLFVFASCNNDDAPEEVQITFKASLAQNANSRALSDGSNINKVKCEVYEGEIKRTEETVDFVNESASYTPTLLKGRTYKVVFWAYKDGAYNVTDLKAITRAKTLSCNDEELDAFTAVVDNVSTEVAGNNLTVTLTRPLAQLRIGTTSEDINSAKSLLSGKDLKKSMVTIDSVYTKYNALSKEASEVQSVTFDKADLIANETFTIGEGEEEKTYNLIAMTYLFADNSSQTSTCNLTVFAGEGEYEEAVHGKNENGGNNSLKYTYVPVKPNTRTNIIGRLLTGNVPYTITLSTGFTGTEQIIGENGNNLNEESDSNNEENNNQ